MNPQRNEYLIFSLVILPHCAQITTTAWLRLHSGFSGGGEREWEGRYHMIYAKIFADTKTLVFCPFTYLNIHDATLIWHTFICTYKNINIEHWPYPAAYPVKICEYENNGCLNITLTIINPQTLDSWWRLESLPDYLTDLKECFQDECGCNVSLGPLFFPNSKSAFPYFMQRVWQP